MGWRGEVRGGEEVKREGAEEKNEDEKERQTDKERESQMTITLLTSVQHWLSITRLLWGKDPPIIGYADPHPASLGCPAST